MICRLSVIILAERQGFEPRVPRSTTVFKTAAIDHSATSPKPLYQKCFSLKAVQRYNSFFDTQIFLGQNLRKIKFGWKIKPAKCLHSPALINSHFSFAYLHFMHIFAQFSQQNKQQAKKQYEKYI